MKARWARRLALAAAVLVSVCLASASVASASGSVPAPVWSIQAMALPTNFAPGEEDGKDVYEALIRNSGSGPTDGSPIAIADSLPAGLEVKGVSLIMHVPGEGVDDLAPELCSTTKSGASESVQCTVPNELSGAEVSLLGPEEALRLNVDVAIPSALSGSLMNVVEVAGGGAPTISTSTRNEVSLATAPTGFVDFQAPLTEGDGLPTTRAGSTPYQFTTSFTLNTALGVEGRPVPAGGDVKSVSVDLPPGLIGNPTATSLCTAQQFNTTSPDSTAERVFNNCPDGSVVGLVHALVEGHIRYVQPVYNLVPPTGMPAQLGFQVVGAPFYIDTRVRTGGDYGITAHVNNLSEAERVSASSVTLWGVPSDPGHNTMRGSCVNTFGGFSMGSCPAGIGPKTFLRLPTSCSTALTTSMRFDTWSDPGTWLERSFGGETPDGCASLDFQPAIAVRPHTTVADTPSGLRVDLHLPQSGNPNLPAEADLRNAVVTLPEGVTVNPSSANGLESCSPAQIDLHGERPASCPDASRIGTVEVDTPLVDHPLPGSVYVAAPHDNPFGSLLAIYIVVDDPQTGVVVKLAGHVTADPSTGLLITRFEDNPQLPFEDFIVEFFDGPRAALRTPPTCGDYTTTTDLTPWSAPESGSDATPSSSFTVSSVPGGGPCVASESARPHRPSFAAGTVAPVAGSFSPLVVQLKREDGSQNLRGLNVALPPGLLGRLVGIPYCPESAIVAASSRSGAAEQAAPSCPAASEVGVVNVGAGAGPTPVYVQGKAYLAGPYAGAPLSLAIVTPAVAGPYDLGTVVVRAALHVDPLTAQVRAVSDPIPTILEGIPLDVRSISMSVDHPRFTLNPTNCKPMSVGGEAISSLGQVASLSSRFEVDGCRGLAFSPMLHTRLFGGTRRSAHPRFRAILTARDGEANIARTTVTLPHSEFLDQGHIKTVCTRVQFTSHACPAGSIYGYAKAVTPLFEPPLEGPVYLRSNGGERSLPDLVAALRGPASLPIEIDLLGYIDSHHGGIRSRFEAVPDAPVSQFTLTMKGGQKGLLQNSTNLCKHRRRATVEMTGQNGRVHDFRPVMGNDCAKHARRRSGS